VGEISIRHQLKSENSFFIFDAFNSSLMANYTNLLIDTRKADKVLGGWVEYFNENYEAFYGWCRPKGTQYITNKVWKQHTINKLWKH
jgi:hypothetical protein